MKHRINRRQALAMLGASTATVALGASVPAMAQTSRLVLGTYGGDSQRNVEAALINPLLVPQGIEVVIEAATDGPREIKLQAEKNLPRGTYDVVHQQSTVLYRLFQQGLIEELDTSRIEGFDQIESVISTPYSVPQSMSARVILYNTEFVSEPPRSYADLWSPELEGKVGLIDQHFLMALAAGALANGGGMSDFEPGKEKLMELKAAGVRVYPSNEAFGQALATGEIWAGIMLQSRAIQWKSGGVPIELVYPSEGVVLDWWGFAIPKNARNKEGAYAFMNAAASDHYHSQWATTMGGTPVTPSALAATSEEVRARVAIPQEYAGNLLRLDSAYLQENYNQLRDWWVRDFMS